MVFSQELFISSLPPYTSEGQEALVLEYAQAQMGSVGYISRDVWSVLELLHNAARLTIEPQELEKLRSVVRKFF